MSAEDDDDAFPRSMRHRKVLDVAEDHPDASIDEIASMVPSATADLVEHVFDQHGDPAAEDADGAAAGDTESADDGHPESEQSDEPPTAADESGAGSVSQTDVDEAESADDDNQESAQPDAPATAADEADATPEEPVSQTDADGSTAVPLADLSDRQRELLEVVARRPDATQGEVADHFDVTRATVSRWASDIEGFEWRDRAEVVAESFGATAAPLSTDGGATTDTAGGEGDTETTAAPDPVAERLEDRLHALESRVAEFESREDGVDVELAHKIAHACLQSEVVSEDEELRILEWLLGSDRNRTG